MATYPDNAVGDFTTDTFSSMADRKPDRGFSVQSQYNVKTFESEAGYEKRKLRTRRVMRTFDLEYTNIDGLMKQAIQNFYDARFGKYESFTLDLGYLGMTGTITVRFDSDLGIQQVKSGASNVLNDVYSVSFKLKEVYD